MISGERIALVLKSVVGGTYPVDHGFAGKFVSVPTEFNVAVISFGVVVPVICLL